MNIFRALKALALGKKVQRDLAPSNKKSTSDSAKSVSQGKSSQSSNVSYTTPASQTSTSQGHSRGWSESSSESSLTNSSTSSADSAPLPRRIVILAPDDTITKTGHMVFDLADRLALVSCDTIIQHDSLVEPLRQFQQACQPSHDRGLNGPYPFFDVTSMTIRRHQEILLSSLLETSSILTTIERSLRSVYAINTTTLVHLDHEAKTSEALIGYLRQFETSIRSTVGTKTTTTNRSGVAMKAEEDYIPRMCTAIEQGRLIRERMETFNRELDYRLKSARPSTNRYPIEH